MAININRNIFAIAIIVLAYTTSMLANDESLISDLIKIYKAEEVRLELKKQAFIEEFKDQFADDGIDMDDAIQSYQSEDSLLSPDRGYDTHALCEKGDADYLLRAHQIFYALLICKKYLKLLESPIRISDIEALITDFTDTKYTDYSIKAVYAKNIITAAYFDLRKQDEKCIKKAKAASFSITGNRERPNEAVTAYLQAKMMAAFIKQDIYAVHNCARYLREARDYCSHISELSEVFLKMLENEFIKLHKYYIEHMEEIDATSETARKVLQRFGWLSREFPYKDWKYTYTNKEQT